MVTNIIEKWFRLQNTYILVIKKVLCHVLGTKGTEVLSHKYSF